MALEGVIAPTVPLKNSAFSAVSAVSEVLRVLGVLVVASL